MQIPRSAQKIHMFLRVVIIHGCHFVPKLVPRPSKEETIRVPIRIWKNNSWFVEHLYGLGGAHHDTISVILSLRH